METTCDFADTRHGRVHYRRAGSGPPLLMLHATPRSSRAFTNLLPHLDTDFQVIAADTLGFGESDPLPGDFTLYDLAESMIDLLDALGIGKTAVFGLHTGNKIGTALAANYPNRVSRLVICGMTHSIILEQAARDAAIAAILKANPIEPRDVANPDERRDREQGQESVARIYPANYRFDLAAAAANVRVPCLVLELVTPLEAHLGTHGDALARVMPNATAQVLEYSDRQLLERWPAKLATPLKSYLATPA